MSLHLTDSEKQNAQDVFIYDSDEERRGYRLYEVSEEDEFHLESVTFPELQGERPESSAERERNKDKSLASPVDQRGYLRRMPSDSQEGVVYPDVEGAGHKAAAQRETPIPTAPPVQTTSGDQTTNRYPPKDQAGSCTEKKTATKILNITDLISRISCIVLSVISFSLIVSDDLKEIEETEYGELVVVSYHFTHFGPYDYLLAASLMAIVYSLPQAATAGLRFCLATRRLDSLLYICISLVLDTICCIVLVTSSSAALGGAMVMNDYVPQTFVSKAYGAAVMALFSCFFALASIAVSLYRLYDKLGERKRAKQKETSG